MLTPDGKEHIFNFLNMKDILDLLSVGLVVLSEEGKISFANRFCKERGLVAHDCEGKRYYEAFKSLDLIGFANGLLEGKAKPLTVNIFGRSYKVSPLGNRALQIEDITELLNFEKLQREFTASVSHELSTPLTAVKGLLETALLQETPSREFLEKALKRLEELERLITSLRLLVLLDSEQKPVREKFSLGDLIGEILQDLREEIDRKGLKVSVSGGNTDLESDREKVYILLKNLIENAVRYNREGGRVSIVAERSEREVKVTVEDTGEGIAKEDMPLLFQPFLGGRNKKGMGLGLAISKKIADFLGAKLNIKSEEGKGTTAEVVFRL